MTNKLNSDILTERELDELKVDENKKQFENNQELEIFLRHLPYSDDFPRYFHHHEINSKIKQY